MLFVTFLSVRNCDFSIQERHDRGASAAPTHYIEKTVDARDAFTASARVMLFLCSP
jgi:hypothetical protein